MTVPGMAKLSIVPNSNTGLPTNFCRTSTYAVSKPTTAVNGAETIAIQIVVKKEFQARPLNTSPKSPRVMPNAST